MFVNACKSCDLRVTYPVENSTAKIRILNKRAVTAGGKFSVFL